MNRRLHRPVGTTALLAALALTATACSSDADGAGGSGSNSGASVAAAADPGVKAAQAHLDEHLANPKSIGLDTPLPSKPETGKSVINLKVPIGLATRIDEAQKAAATSLGWDYSNVDAGFTPASAASAFEAAIAKKPDAIIFGGFPAAVFTKQIAQAKAAGVAVVSGGTGDPAVDGVLADIAGASQQQLYGKLSAAYFVSKAGPASEAAAFNFKGFPISDLFTNSFVASVKEFCPTCKTEIVQQQLSDIGTKIPANAVGFFQRKPDVKWAVFASGDMATGVVPALKTAGVQGVNIIGITPAEANLAALKSGTETAWVGYPLDILGWRLMDTLARVFTNADAAAAAKVTLPLQMVTQDNVGSAVTDNGYYTGVDGYQNQFKSLWKVS